MKTKEHTTEWELNQGKKFKSLELNVNEYKVYQNNGAIKTFLRNFHSIKRLTHKIWEISN